MILIKFCDKDIINVNIGLVDNEHFYLIFIMIGKLLIRCSINEP